MQFSYVIFVTFDIKSLFFLYLLEILACDLCYKA